MLLLTYSLQIVLCFTEGTTVDSGVIDPVVSTTAKVGAKEAGKQHRVANCIVCKITRIMKSSFL